MAYDISQSYYPLVLEMRDTAVEINETLQVYNNRVVLTEIPDTFMKVYLSGYIEVEDKLPNQGEFVVDYKTGIVTFGGTVKNNTGIDASYYGLGIIQYPAERIYSHNDNPEVAGSLQSILDRGVDAVTELNATADLSKRQNHANTSSFFANQDWTRMIYKTTGAGQALYNDAVDGVEISSELWTFINVRIPVDPESTYWVRAKVKKTVGDGKLYIGAVSLDNDYNEINTDQASAYNYFGANAVTITSGSTQTFEGSISGYNLTTGSSQNKFDPDAKYFNLVIVANFGTTADISKTLIQWLEIYRSPKSMNVSDSGSFGGALKVYGQTDMYSNLVVNNHNINDVNTINGHYGTIIKSIDEWLRINDDFTHTNGVYFGSSLVRTDGALQVGNTGATLSVDGTTFKYKTLMSVDATTATIASTNASITGNTTVGGTLTVNGASTLKGAVTINGTSLSLTAGYLSAIVSLTTPAIYAKQDGTGDIARFGSTADDSKFIVTNNGSLTSKGALTLTGSGSIGGTLGVTGATTLNNTLTVSGVTTINNSVLVSTNVEAVGKVWVGKNTTYGASALLTLTLGDADTGFNWTSDGVFDMRANNAIIADFSSTAFNVNKKLNAKASLSVTGTFDVSSNATVSGTLGVTGATTLSSTLGVTGATTLSSTLTVSGATSMSGDLNMNDKNITNINSLAINDGGTTEGISWTGTNFRLDVSDIANTSETIFDTFHIYGTTGNIKLWRPTYIVGNTDVTGNITVSGTVDGVDVSAFKTAFDTHNHDALYVNVTGDTMTGALTISQSANNPALLLQGATAGWASGIQLNNTTATTGKKYGIYSDSTGNLQFTNETSSFSVLVFDPSGNGTIKKNLSVAGTLAVTGISTLTGATTMSGQVSLNNNMIVADTFAIRPATANGATLGTIDFPFADVYVGANSLYIDGKQVVSSTSNTIDIHTDVDQHLSVSTSGLGTTRLASGKDVTVYSGQTVTVQSVQNMSVLASGLISIKSDTNGSGIELVSQSALGNINITSTNQIQLSGTNGIVFTQLPKVGSTNIQLVTDAIAPSRVTQDASNRFVTDADKTNWNGKLDKAGGTMTGFLTLNADPTQALHAVTKQYVDAIKQSLDIKDSVRVATTANVTITGDVQSSTLSYTIDGVVLANGNRVLVKSQTAGAENGIYTVVITTNPAKAEVSSLTITAIPTAVGNVTVTLNGVATNIALDTATDTTTTAVATKIRGTAYTGWTTGGTGSTVTFTSTTTGTKTDSTYSAGSTGSTGTMSTTTQGTVDSVTAVYTRATDFNSSTNITSGAFTFVEEGTASGNMGFVQTTDGTITVGTTSLSFTQFSGAGQVIAGTGISKSGNTISLASGVVTAGTYKSVTVDTYGRVTAGTNPTTLSGYGITDAVAKAGSDMTGMLTFNALNGIRSGGASNNALVLYANGGNVYLRPNGDSGSSTCEFIVSPTNVTYAGNVMWHQGNDGLGSGLDADLLDGLQGSSYMRTDANTTTTGILKANRLVGVQNGFTVTILTGQSTVTLTHNFGNTNYKVALGTNNINRHAGWLNKTANTVDIVIDDVFTSDIVVDVILMPIL